MFFHKSSGVLIVTDLIENFPKQHFNYLQQLVAKVVGILAPNGKMPIDWRLSFIFSKFLARQHLSQILSWKPNMIIMSHGLIVEKDAQVFLRHSFAWLR